MIMWALVVAKNAEAAAKTILVEGMAFVLVVLLEGLSD